MQTKQKEKGRKASSELCVRVLAFHNNYTLLAGFTTSRFKVVYAASANEWCQKARFMGLLKKDMLDISLLDITLEWDERFSSTVSKAWTIQDLNQDHTSNFYLVLI